LVNIDSVIKYDIYLSCSNDNGASFVNSNTFFVEVDDFFSGSDGFYIGRKTKIPSIQLYEN